VPQPTLTKGGQFLYDSLAPLAQEDEANGWATANLCNALGAMFDQVLGLIQDQDDGTPGWAILFDPDLCPAELLSFPAQMQGVTLPPGLTEAQQRLRIKETDGFKRGTPKAIKGAARQHLVGPGGDGSTATVYLLPNHGGVGRLTVTTWASETPDPAKVHEALLEQKPFWIVLTSSTIVGGDLQTLRDTHLDYAEIAADFTDLDDIRSDPSQT
jgi:hypothetical protein